MLLETNTSSRHLLFWNWTKQYDRSVPLVGTSFSLFDGKLLMASPLSETFALLSPTTSLTRNPTTASIARKVRSLDTNIPCAAAATWLDTALQLVKRKTGRNTSSRVRRPNKSAIRNCDRASLFFTNMTKIEEVTSGQECPICYDEIVQPLYSTGRRLICGHWFHALCIQEWFRRIAAPVCPYCKRAPTEQDQYKFLVRKLLLCWGSKNDNVLFDGSDFALIFNWSYHNQENLGVEYRELNSLDTGTFVSVANELFPLLVDQSYFTQCEGGFMYST